MDRRLKTYEYATPSELMDELNKTLDDAAGNILKYLDIIQYSSREETEPHHITELDQKQLALQKEEIVWSIQHCYEFYSFCIVFLCLSVFLCNQLEPTPESFIFGPSSWIAV